MVRQEIPDGIEHLVDGQIVPVLVRGPVGAATPTILAVAEVQVIAVVLRIPADPVFHLILIVQAQVQDAHALIQLALDEVILGMAIALLAEKRSRGRSPVVDIISHGGIVGIGNVEIVQTVFATDA